MLLGVYVYNIIYISEYSHIVPFTFFDNGRHRRGWQRLIRNYGWIYSLGRSFFRLWSLPHSRAPASWRERAGEKYLYIYINARTHTYIYITNNGGRRVGEVEAGDAGITVVKFVVFCSDVATGFVGINSRVGTGAAGVRVGIGRDSGWWEGFSERDFINDSVARELTAARPSNHFSLLLLWNKSDPPPSRVFIHRFNSQPRWQTTLPPNSYPRRPPLILPNTAGVLCRRWLFSQ